MSLEKNLLNKGISCASFAIEGNIAKVTIPIRQNLSVSSVISALGRFKDWKLLNAIIILTEEGSLVQFIFQVPPSKGVKEEGKTT